MSGRFYIIMTSKAKNVLLKNNNTKISVEKKQNEKKIKTFFSKKMVAFFVVLFLGWFGLSRADLGGPNIFIDSDQDGLTDSEEASLGTDAYNPDSDKDGYNDGVEVASGYDPLKPAPGDKLVNETVSATEVSVAGESVAAESDENLTEKFLTELEQQKSEEISLLQNLTEDPSLLEDEDTLGRLEEISLTNDEIESIFAGDFSSTEATEELELISEEEFNILPEVKEKDDDQKKEEEKEQIEKYVASVAFLMATYSPFETTGNEELSSLGISLVMDMVGYIDMGNEDKLSQYREKAQIILEKMKEVEVPYVMKDAHILGASLFNYLLANVDEEDFANDDDPVEMMMALGKLQSVLIEFQNLQTQLEEIMEEYGISAISLTGDAD